MNDCTSVVEWKIWVENKVWLIETNNTVFPSKSMPMWHPVAHEEIGGRWEQFHDCFLSETTRRWCPMSRIMSHKKVSQKEAYLGNVHILRNSFLSIGSCQKLDVSWRFDASFACCKVKKTFGRFQLEAPRAYKCKQILGLCHLPPRMENQCGLWKKILCEVKKCIQHTPECDD